MIRYKYKNLRLYYKKFKFILRKYSLPNQWFDGRNFHMYRYYIGKRIIDKIVVDLNLKYDWVYFVHYTRLDLSSKNFDYSKFIQLANCVAFPYMRLFYINWFYSKLVRERFLSSYLIIKYFRQILWSILFRRKMFLYAFHAITYIIQASASYKFTLSVKKKSKRFLLLPYSVAQPYRYVGVEGWWHYLWTYKLLSQKFFNYLFVVRLYFVLFVITRFIRLFLNCLLLKVSIWVFVDKFYRRYLHLLKFLRKKVRLLVKFSAKVSPVLLQLFQQRRIDRKWGIGFLFSVRLWVILQMLWFSNFLLLVPAQNLFQLFTNYFMFHKQLINIEFILQRSFIYKKYFIFIVNG